jgi:hypothetical protein
MEYRYRILRHRYLGLGSEQAYRNLTTRLAEACCCGIKSVAGLPKAATVKEP